MRWLPLLVPSLLAALGPLACSAPQPPLIPPPAPAESTQTAASFPTELPVLSGPTPDPSPDLLRSAQYLLSAFANRAPAWSYDSRTVLFLSTREGRSAPWASSWTGLDLPPDRLAPDNVVADAAAFFPDNVSALVLAHPPDRDAAVLLRADLASGISQPLAQLDGLSPRQLLIPRGARSTAVLLAHDRAARTSLVFVLHPLDAPPRRVVDLPGAWTLLDVSPTGTHALVAQTTAPTMTEIELSRGAASELPVPGALRATTAAYGRDRQEVWVAGTALDRGCLFRARPAVHAPAPYCVDGSRVIRAVRRSPASSRLAVTVDWLDRSEVHFLGGSTPSRPTVARLPVGTGDLVGFSPSGKVATVAWETPTSPPDMFEVDPLRGGVRRLRADVRPTLALFDDMTSRTVELAPAGAPLRIIVHAPSTAWDGRSQHHPLVVLVGSRVDGPWMRWDPFVRLLVARGFAVIEPLASASGPGPSQDAEAVLDQLRPWLASLPWADAQRAGVVDSSATGHVAFSAHRKAREAWPVAVEVRAPSWEPPPAEAGPAVTAAEDNADFHPHDSGELEVADVAGVASVEPATRLAGVVAFLERQLVVTPASRGF